MNLPFILLFLALFQSSFDSARVHSHVASSTYEGVWIKRMFVATEKPGEFPLGNQLAVRGPTNELWFYYGFDPIKDGPTISMAESTPSGMRTRVTYDPVCFYVTKLELLGPVVVPTPTPTPTPSPSPTPSPTPSYPVYEFKKFKYGGKESERDAADTQSAKEGYSSCAPYDGWLRCRRLKILER